MATASSAGFKPTIIDIDGILDQSIRKGLAMLWRDFLLPLLPTLWPYLLGFAIWIIGGIILQIVMIRTGGHKNRLSSRFNALVGSLTYGVFFGILLVFAYLIWGVQVIDELWFVIIGALAFLATGLFLRAIGFWYR